MKEAIEALIQKSANTAMPIREVAQQILTHFESDLLFETLCDYIESLTLARYEWVVLTTALCLIDRERANQFFADLLFVNDSEKQYRLIKLLALYGNEVVVPSLINILESHNEPDIRYIAAYTLGEIGDKRALSILEAAKNDSHENYEGTPVSVMAVSAIEKILKA